MHGARAQDAVRLRDELIHGRVGTRGDNGRGGGGGRGGGAPGWWGELERHKSEGGPLAQRRRARRVKGAGKT